MQVQQLEEHPEEGASDIRSCQHHQRVELSSSSCIYVRDTGLQKTYFDTNDDFHFCLILYRNTYFNQSRASGWAYKFITIMPILALQALSGGISITNTRSVRYTPPVLITRSHPSLEYDRSLKQSQLVAVDKFVSVSQLLDRFVVSVVMLRSNIDLRFCSCRWRRSGI